MNIDQAFQKKPTPGLFALTPGPCSTSELTGQFVGEIGKRQEMILTVTAKVKLDSGYAIWLFKFADLSGNEVVWFASTASELDVGGTYRIKATVKRHGVYQETRQTVLNRPKVIGPYLAPVVRQYDVEHRSEDVVEAFLDI